jgi:ferrous iron transport protein A
MPRGGRHGEGWRRRLRIPSPPPAQAASNLPGGPAETPFPLSQAEIGAPLEIVQILNAGGVAQRLRPMGLAPGDPVRVVRGAPFWGPIVVEVPGRVLALGRGVARHVLVLRVPHPSTQIQPESDTVREDLAAGDH